MAVVCMPMFDAFFSAQFTELLPFYEESVTQGLLQPIFIKGQPKWINFYK